MKVGASYFVPTFILFKELRKEEENEISRMHTGSENRKTERFQ